MVSAGPATLSNIVTSLLTQAPVLLVMLIGLVLALTRWRRHPRASAFLAAGIAILFLGVLFGAMLNGALPWLASRTGGSRLGALVGAVSLVRSFVTAGAWGLVLAAVFADRAK